MLNKKRDELLVDIGADIDRSKNPSTPLSVSGECASMSELFNYSIP